jgi:pimeloyl-ACP methyl ester carboxylesterase
MINPAFAPTPEQIANLKRDAGGAPEPERPLVIISGYHSPPFPAMVVRGLLGSFGACRRDSTLVISDFCAWRIEQAVESALKAMRSKGWANGEAVDVVGISMGGVVARVLAADCGIKIARLYTLASPHLGARITRFVRPDAAARELIEARNGKASPLLKRLDTCLYHTIGELTCYAMLRDWMVGATNTAPPGYTPLWLDTNRPLAPWLSHFSITSDRRVMADLACRLMKMQPLAQVGTPPPRD